MKNILTEKSAYRVQGRHTWQGDVLFLAYSASYVEFCFTGTKATATLVSDFFESEDLCATAAVFVDDDSTPLKRFALLSGEHEYDLYEGEKRNVKIRLMKYSEAPFAYFGIKEVGIDGEVTALPKEKDFFIEFIGDSITCGYGIEGKVDVDTFNTKQENPWNAYACKVARTLDADFQLFSWSGNGVVSHYIDPSIDEANHNGPFMQELYPFADWALESRLGRVAFTPWKATREPDLLVVFLGTNDSSYTREIPERNAEYKKTYMQFIRDLRNIHPTSKILCTLGTMDQRLTDTLEESVKCLQEEGVKEVYYQYLPFRDENDGLGTDYHPSEVMHDKDCKRLVKKIKEIFN